MKVNGVDLRRFGARQLNVEVQPPKVAVDYELPKGALTPTVFDTDVGLGHLKLCIYFKEKDRNTLIRRMSDFMQSVTKESKLELDGYKGVYIGLLTSDDYEQTIARGNGKLRLEFDGYFCDSELEITFDGAGGEINLAGSRRTPCAVEVRAKRGLTDYEIYGVTDEPIVIDSMSGGDVICIDGTAGTVLQDGENAFRKVDLWEFPYLKPGKNILRFSGEDAVVKVRYSPMWI